MTLTEFLLARIAEDEALAEQSLQVGDKGAQLVAIGDPSAPAVLIVHPQRVLAECEAKRQIVEMQAANDEDRYLPGFHYKAQMIERVLRTLALPHADHPDFRAEWKP